MLEHFNLTAELTQFSSGRKGNNCVVCDDVKIYMHLAMKM